MKLDFTKMPHLIVEYSANLEDKVDIQNLVRTIHAAALETGLFPLGGIRTRAHRCDHYEIADGHPDNGFVHLTGKIGPGRDLQARKSACTHIFSALTETLTDVFASSPLGISFELTELDAETRLNRNNLHDIIKLRLDADAS